MGLVKDKFENKNSKDLDQIQSYKIAFFRLDAYKAQRTTFTKKFKLQF